MKINVSSRKKKHVKLYKRLYIQVFIVRIITRAGDLEIGEYGTWKTD